jgi:hypothetical protein
MKTCPKKSPAYILLAAALGLLTISGCDNNNNSLTRPTPEVSIINAAPPIILFGLTTIPQAHMPLGWNMPTRRWPWLPITKAWAIPSWRIPSPC